MAVRIRLKRIGRRHRPSYRITAVDARCPRNGRVLEELGSYDPVHEQEDKQVVLVRDRIEYWLGVGAQPSDTVARILEKHEVGKPTAGAVSADAASSGEA